MILVWFKPPIQHTMWTPCGQLTEKCLKAQHNAFFQPPYFLCSPAAAENYRQGHYGWRVVIPVLSRPDKQRQRILLKGSVMMRHWQSPVCLSRASGCSRELELYSLPFTVAACDGEPVNVQPQTGTDAGLLPWRHTTSSVFIHHLLGGWRKHGGIFEQKPLSTRNFSEIFSIYVCITKHTQY